ncbi:MAG: hypothetical protein KDF58_00050 [Alphaproteobacteria bacterium]|nr:hypothetical protein [Alphaproteobacteria bacterium]
MDLDNISPFNTKEEVEKLLNWKEQESKASDIRATSELLDKIQTLTIDSLEKFNSFLNIVFAIFYISFFTLWSQLENIIPFNFYLISAFCVSISILMFFVYLFIIAQNMLSYSAYVRWVSKLLDEEKINFEEYVASMRAADKIINDRYRRAAVFCSQAALWLALIGIFILVFTILIVLITSWSQNQSVTTV